MPNIKKTFTFKVPNDYMSDDFSQGKTDTYTYEGPEYLTFQISKDTGRETSWCLWEDRDLERPCPLDSERIKVDCKENPLLCEIGNDQGRQDSINLRMTRKWIVQHQAPEGYQSLYKPEVYEPRDFYDEYNITYNFETKNFNIPVKTHFINVPENISWDMIRARRNRELEASDGKISDDMPQELQNKWKTYRQLLRDLPDALASFPPHIAAQMFPLPPVNTPKVV